MANQESNNSGQGSGQGGSSRPRPGHGNATPSGDARPQQSNSEATAQSTREETGESSSQQGNSSTSNHGNRGNHGAPIRGSFFGPRGQRNRGRGGYQGRQPDHRARAPEYAPLAAATKSSHEQVADVGGAVGSRLINNSLEGGNSHHWYSQAAGQMVWGETRGGGVDQQIEDMKKQTGCKSVQFFLIPENPDRFNKIAGKAFERTWVDNSGYNDKGKPAGILRHGVKIDSKTKKPTKCVACGNKGHTVATCFSMPSGRDGAQVGCPRCDTTKHHGGDCKEIAALPLPEQVKVLISRRANMTPFKGEKPWWRLVHEYCMSRHFDASALTALPWSKEFTTSKAKGKDIGPMQARFDTTPGFNLPVDPATLGPVPLYWKYWEPNSLQWPPVLGPIPQRDSMDTSGGTETVTAPAPAPETGAAPGPVLGPTTGPASGAQPPVSGDDIPPSIAGNLGLAQIRAPRPIQGPATGDALPLRQGPATGEAPEAVQNPAPDTSAGDGKFEIDYEDME